MMAVMAALAGLPATLPAQEVLPEEAAPAVTLSANIGWLSEYIYRGIPQKTSSASAGLDLAAGPFSVGTWAADVGDGNEVDVYSRLGTALGNFRAAAGGTAYFYTGDFDHTYLEGNVEAGYGPLSTSFALGTHYTTPRADYWYAGVTGEYAGFAVTVGHFDYNDDAASSGNYGQARYGFSLQELLDVSIAWVVSDEDLSGLGRVDNKLILGLGKKFTIR
jgi:uncharacterized protein (TIGR02001 family)